MGSGFKHIETNVYEILRLLHIKGRKDVTAMEVSDATVNLMLCHVTMKNAPQYCICMHVNRNGKGIQYPALIFDDNHIRKNEPKFFTQVKVQLLEYFHLNEYFGKRNSSLKIR